MVDIIATTTAEKIKKLASLSSDIIEEYGMGYFIKVAIHEMRKQKLNLLRPDSPPKIFLETDMEKYAIEAYAEFFKKNKLELTKDEIKKTIDELNYRPKFTILIDSVHFYVTADKKNIKSLL